jgi:hypothetical protein
LICTYVAATVPVEKEGAKNALLDSAIKIGLEDEFDEEEQQQKKSPAEPEPGSYERFMMTFGSPARWAGR